jgi:hypothetical protein
VALLLPAILGLPLVLWLLAHRVPELRGLPLAQEAIPAPLPPPGWAALRDRSFQARAEALFAEQLPPRRTMVELVNQLEYDLFGRSYMYGEMLVIGRGDTLFERPYISRWCASSADPAPLGRTADQIAALRDRFVRDGRALIVLITPSKPAIVPELLPPACLPPADPDGPRRTFAALLAARGIPVLDGHEAAMAMKRDDPLPPFPRGGTHWSRLAAHRVASMLLEEAGRQAGADLGGLSVSAIGWSAAPAGQDSDLARLLNLYSPPLDYRVGAGTIDCRPTEVGARGELVAVGGSFLWEVLASIAACRLFAAVDYLYYYDNFEHRWPEDRRSPIVRAALSWRDRLSRARVLLLEINEEMIGKAGTHLDRFLDDALPQLR